MRFALFCYYRDIRLIGQKKLPSDVALMFLPNHQNGLMDPLLVAAYSRLHKPFFLTRSDVFKGRFLRAMFTWVRMIPVYRLRDGRNTLEKNYEVFDTCARLLGKGESLLLFPEANHNLQRRLRPLKNGFIRIVEQYFRQNSHGRLYFVPMGVNYDQATEFPDRVSIYYGDPIALDAKTYLSRPKEVVSELKIRIREAMEQLSLHLPESVDEKDVLDQLRARGIDFTDPFGANAALKTLIEENTDFKTESAKPFGLKRGIFNVINLPLRLPWILLKKRFTWDPEFTSTFRFAYGFICYPLYMLLLGLLLSWLLGANYALLALLTLFIFNLWIVKSS